MREQSPEKFFSRIVNQLWYGIVGWHEIWTPHCTNLKRFIKLCADGVEIELPEDTEGLIFSNIPSFGGGMKLWDVDNGKTPSNGLSNFLRGPSLSALDRAATTPRDTTFARNSMLMQRKVKSSSNLFGINASDFESVAEDGNLVLF